ncbi:MAG TPA: tRNA uridine-5-carboxymethylaminomethyl(34) synthesis GTPase MnmE [Dokdonella sp.]|uniref:tRNA uridine-5-carboxymethylaminomethyl(34) synthesis GTPase MnmE n=1 Tax=Dokdonella sp. TaxID=2291710 RepID=UPI002D7E812F|nr:tRNA uridine-5-carboxymethylaminomethyl(34) synthesis GTPase MnmE [Dokdonella sp.]HET9031421.1 tRNA uridine-5-carboxymethylaminomethyl(34) synthesis GTPase MnmE [Dokdonella sp.]
MKPQAETIAAIASAAGAGGIGIIRVSGFKALDIATTLLGRKPKPRYAHYCTFTHADGALLDQGLLLYFPAPNSFTGEDVIELQVHGSPVVLALLLRRVIALGARQARAGEFSERAFLNGKIDLTQAEAIADLIASGSEAAARAAVRSLDGEFSRQVHALTESVVRLRIWIEAAIDFPEEEIDFLATPRLVEDLAALRHALDELLVASRRGVRLADGLHVVIVGQPNAGKSSLLNALAASDRAIVTEVAGTTRDVLREIIDLDGTAITLVDTAGLRESEDRVEIEGIRRARMELERADLAVLVSSDAQVETDLGLLDGFPANRARIIIHNKIDLDTRDAQRKLIDNVVHLWLSAKTGTGVDQLHAELRNAAGLGEGGDGAFSARSRHVEALERASEHLHSARYALCEQRAGELAAEELRQLQHELGEITGTFSSDDLLGRIFADFCIGK